MSFVVDTTYAIEGGVVVAGVLAFVIAWLMKGKVATETQTLMEKNKAALESRIAILEQDRSHDRTRITELEKEVSIIKDIPLQKLADNYDLISQHLSSILEAQNKILATQNVLLAAVSTDTKAGATVNINNPATA